MTGTATRITRSTTVSVGDRVRLIDARGDMSSTAVVGDMGTVLRNREWILDVMMDSGHETARNRDRWELVTSEAEQRAIWAALPIEQAYPIGSQWHHRTYGDAVYEVRNHRGATELSMRYVSGGHADSSRHDQAWWTRRALDTFGTPVGVIPSSPVVEATDTPEEPVEAPQEPWAPSVGDRVIVVRDVDEPSNVGKSAEVVDVQGYSSDRFIRVRYDDRQHGGEYGWWVGEVRPELPATPEEYKAAIEKAREEGQAHAVANMETAIRDARREGREAATLEAAEHMERIVESAHQYAYDNSLCSQFDRFMVENGLRPRDTYTQQYRVDVTYTVYVEARPDDSDAIREAAMERVNSGYESPEIDWEES